ncbi:MAG: DUF4292 domain-containing protein [Arcticibacter sp.]
MRKDTLSKVVFLCLLTFCFACRAKKEVAPPVASVPSVVNSKTASIKAITENAFNFKTLSAKAKIDFKFNNQSNGASLNLRMRNKEVIWMSITAIAGIEVARVMITPDSIKVHNRLQGEYLAKPFNFISQYSSRAIDFNILQNLLVGNATQGAVTEASEIHVTGSETAVKTAINGLMYELVFNDIYKLTENKLRDSKDQQLTALYSNFQALNGRNLPYAVSMLSNAGNKNVRIDIKYSSVSVNEPVDFPFSVPKRFTVKD